MVTIVKLVTRPVGKYDLILSTTARSVFHIGAAGELNGFLRQRRMLYVATAGVEVRNCSSFIIYSVS